MRTLTKKLRYLLVLSLLLGVGLISPPMAGAQDVSLFFPFITTEAGKFTFISILNDGDNSIQTTGNSPVSYHYTYATKPAPLGVDGTPGGNKRGCDHFDGDGTITPFDIVFFEVSNKIPGGAPPKPLFGDVTSTPVQLFVAGRIGWLIVEAAANAAAPATNGTAALSGTAAVIDTASGLALSYSTAFLTAPASVGPPALPNPNLTFVEGFDPTQKHFVNWYPDSIVNTSWYVVPLSLRSLMTSQATGGTLRLGLTSDTRTLRGGAFDLDEHFFSGALVTRIRCLGIVKRSDFLNINTVAATAGGGWTRTNGTFSSSLSVLDPDDPGSGSPLTSQIYLPLPHVMYKIQTTTALGGTITTIHREPNAAPLNPSILIPGALGDITP